MTHHENNGNSIPEVSARVWKTPENQDNIGKFSRRTAILAGISLAAGGVIGCSSKTDATGANSEASASATAVETNSESYNPATSSATPEVDAEKPDGLANKDDYLPFSTRGAAERKNSYEDFIAAAEVFAHEGVDITAYNQFYYNEKFEAVGDPDSKPTPSQVAELKIAQLNVAYKVAQGGNPLDQTVAEGLVGSISPHGGLEEALGSFYSKGTKSGSWSKPAETIDAQDLVTTFANNSEEKPSMDELVFPLKFIEVTHISSSCINLDNLQNPFGSKFYEVVVKVEEGDGDTSFVQMILAATRHSVSIDRDGNPINHMTKAKNDPETDPETLANIADIEGQLEDRRYYTIVALQPKKTGDEKGFAFDFSGSYEGGDVNEFPTYEAMFPPEEE